MQASSFHPYDTNGYQFTLESPDGVEGYFIGRIDLRNLNKLDSEGFPALATALGEYTGTNLEAKKRVEALALYILESTKNPNPDFEENVPVQTPSIFYAIRLNMPKVVKKMVDLDIPKNLAKTFFGEIVSENPLEEARKSHHQEIIQILEDYYTQ